MDNCIVTLETLAYSFSKDNTSLLTGACISFLSNTFWTSLTVFGMFFLWPLCDQVIRHFDQIKPSKIKQSKISLQITDHLKWTLHMWENPGKHLRAKHNGLKSHPLWQRLLWGGSLVLINDHYSVNKNSEVLLKIYMVEFEIWLGKWKNAPSIGSGIQAYKK